MINTILFDLDGTLLPLDQDTFIKAYFGLLAQHLAPYGYEAKPLYGGIMAGTDAMIKNDGSKSNEDAFWDTFCALMGRDARVDEPHFAEYYRTGFQQVAGVCGFDAAAKPTVEALKAKGYTLALATNPIFPAIATQSRIRWAGLDESDFATVTTYENSRYCKPNPDYYREVLAKIGKQAEECLMVGNSVEEDMVAESLGMKVFLFTQHLINPNNADISRYPQGGCAELLAYIETLN
ncbi:MAG: HAD family hydrolase [Firmicutes bacterium]|nr:HAD family hydrolase [Bacillota bacterium]